MKGTRVHLSADLPDEDVASFLQVIRTWEREHQHVEMAVTMENDMPLRQAEEIFDALAPGFPFKRVWTK